MVQFAVLYQSDGSVCCGQTSVWWFSLLCCINLMVQCVVVRRQSDGSVCCAVSIWWFNVLWSDVSLMVQFAVLRQSDGSEVVTLMYFTCSCCLLFLLWFSVLNFGIWITLSMMYENGARDVWSCVCVLLRDVWSCVCVLLRDVWSCVCVLLRDVWSCVCVLLRDVWSCVCVLLAICASCWCAGAVWRIPWHRVTPCPGKYSTHAYWCSLYTLCVIHPAQVSTVHMLIDVLSTHFVWYTLPR